MALRAVPEHPKFAKLKKELGISKFEALGLLETLWHFVGKFSPRGNVGRFSDSDIEAWIEWTGKPGTAVAALTASGWLDESAEHRLVVHDWHNHADSTTKKQVGRTGPRQGGFVSDMSEPTPTEQVNVQVIPQETRPPEPVPVPAPVPVPEKRQKQPQAAFELPAWVDRPAWESFEALRKRGGKRTALDDGSRALCIRKLESLRRAGHDPTDVLNNSVMNGYLGLFEPKGGNNGATQQNRGGVGRSEQALAELAKAGVTFADRVPESGVGEVRATPGRSDGRDAAGFLLEGSG